MITLTSTHAHPSSDDLESLALNPFQIAMRSDPYPAYAALRERRPVHAVPGCLGRDWILSRYVDVHRVLTDPRCGVDDLPARIRRSADSAADPSSVATLTRTLDSWLFFVEGGEQRRLHRFMSPRFTPSEVARRRLSIRRRAHALLDALEQSGEHDLMHGFARKLPMLVGADMLGVGLPELERFVQIGQDLFSVFTVPTPLRRYRHLDRQMAHLSQFLREVLAEKRALPCDDLASDLGQHVACGSLSEHEALALCAMVLSVGQDTTQHFIGNALHALLEHPEQLQVLRARPELMPTAVKELARFDTPVQVVVHVAREPIEIGSERIEAGERIHFYLAAAHRDPEVFEHADRLDLCRTQSSRLLFGAGPHFCLGAHLALLTTEEALSALLERFVRLRWRDGATKRWIKSLHMRGLVSLPVAWS